VASQGTEAVATGRFPAPNVAWMVNQIPRELHALFGFRGEEIPDVYEAEIEYLYEIAYPNGDPYPKPLLVHYIEHAEVPVAFIIGDEIDLDGVTMTVKNWTSRDMESPGMDHGYTCHQVTVGLPEAIDG
jgi:hypothetical protein